MRGGRRRPGRPRAGRRRGPPRPPAPRWARRRAGHGGGLQVTDPETAGAQRAGRPGAPLVQQQLDAPDRLEGGAGRGPVDQGLLAGRARQRGQVVDRLPGGATAAQRQADLAGQHHHAATAGHQQAPGQQLLGGGGRLLGEHGVPGGPGGRLAAVVGHVLEQRPGRPGQLGEPALDLGRRRRLRGHRAQAAVAVPGAAGEAVGHPGQGAQALVGLPDQGQVHQPVHGGLDRRGCGVHDRDQPLPGGLAEHDEGIQSAELEPVQVVERTQQRGPGGDPGRQLAEVVRGRSGEIGALDQQPGQPVVRPAAQLVGHRAEPGLAGR